MATSFNTAGNYEAKDVRSVKNSNGTYTYTATLAGLPVTWNDGTADRSCTASVVITIEAPSNCAEPGPGNMFRFSGNGGYNVHISGTDFP